MSIIPSRDEIMAELEQFADDYPDSLERTNIIADYVEQVVDEASCSCTGHKEKTRKRSIEKEDLLMEIYDMISEGLPAHNDRLGVQRLAKNITNRLINDYHIFTE